MKRILVLGLAVVLAASCSWWGSSADAAREAAVRHLIEHHERTAQSKRAPYYLLVEGAPPSERFLARFAGNEPPLVAASPTTHDLAANRPLHGPGAERITIWVSDFDQSAEHRASIQGGFYGADLGRQQFSIELVREGGRWRVADLSSRRDGSSRTAR